MKSYLVALIGLFFLVGCKKTKYDKFTTGSEKKMIVTQHDRTIQGINSDGLTIDEAGINLDNAGVSDVVFKSIKDSVELYGNTETEIWIVSLTVKNNDFQVLDIPKSGDLYTSETGYFLEGGMGMPRMVKTVTHGCEREGAAYSSFGPNTARSFKEGEILTPQDYDWYTGNGIYADQLELVNSGYSGRSCEFNSAQDSLFCTDYVYAPNCDPIPENELTYLTFRKNVSEGYRFGWIELYLTDDNKLEIKRSAISAKTLCN